MVTTHANIEAQVTALVETWQWSADDRILNILPLHHVHGIVNVLSCALWTGACCVFLPRFDEGEVLEVFRRGEVNVFMAVPTIYYKLIHHYRSLPEAEQRGVSEATTEVPSHGLRLGGPAVSVLEEWRDISGHTPPGALRHDRDGYGHQQSLRGRAAPGHIGQPLDGVTVRLADDGEIQVKGPNVFHEYWGPAGGYRGYLHR